jgi:hypothetical protein
VLWTTGQTGENKDAAVRRPANPFHRHLDLPFDITLQSRYIGEWSNATTGSDGSFPSYGLSVTVMAVTTSLRTVRIMAPTVVAARSDRGACRRAC